VAPLLQSARSRGAPELLECVVNVSEGRDQDVLARLADRCASALLDVHSDPDHNRSVFTLACERERLMGAVRRLAEEVVQSIDLTRHLGAHPRFGSLDVVPWVALQGWPVEDRASIEPAKRARDAFASWAASALDLPVFLYGPERSLPEVRKQAWVSRSPDLGPSEPHPSAGSSAVGCRPLMVAYNLWLAEANLAQARRVAAAVRSPQVRALAFWLRGAVQVSCNLIAPFELGPAEVADRVSALAKVERAELVGLVPKGVLEKIPRERWQQLDLSAEQSIEARLEAASGP